MSSVLYDSLYSITVQKLSWREFIVAHMKAEPLNHRMTNERPSENKGEKILKESERNV